MATRQLFGKDPEIPEPGLPGATLKCRCEFLLYPGTDPHTLACAVYIAWYPPAPAAPDVSSSLPRWADDRWAHIWAKANMQHTLPILLTEPKLTTSTPGKDP